MMIAARGDQAFAAHFQACHHVGILREVTRRQRGKLQEYDVHLARLNEGTTERPDSLSAASPGLPLGNETPR
jgi:hypothetical protein